MIASTHGQDAWISGRLRRPRRYSQICRHTVAYRPGAISEALTEHYRRAHPETPGLASR